tara:strand:+ start:802 stop:903 length:102 start_codon:yes stop_codon:yes gene_type:complete
MQNFDEVIINSTKDEVEDIYLNIKLKEIGYTNE